MLDCKFFKNVNHFNKIVRDDQDNPVVEQTLTWTT